MSEQDSGKKLRTIAERLSSSEEETRRSAVVELSAFPLRVSREYLFTAMGDSSWRVRKEAVEVVLEVQETQVLQVQQETQEPLELLETSLQVAQEDQQLQALNFQFQLLHRQLIQLQLLLEDL